MRKAYKSKRNRLVELLKASPVADKITILEQDAGLHFLLRVETELEDEALKRRWREAGIRVRALGDYYHGQTPPEARRCLVVDYSGLTEEAFAQLETALQKL